MLTEPFEIDYLYSPATISDDAVSLQRVGDKTDAGSLYAQHVGKKLLRQYKAMIAGALRHYGQPTAEPSLDRMKMVADACLSHLFE